MFQELKEWEAKRLGKFTSSEIHRLLQKGKKKGEYFGAGAMTYINEKVAEIITGQPAKDLTGVNATEWGNAHEYEALVLLQDTIGQEFTVCGGSNSQFFPLNDFSGGSPDAYNDIYLVEQKCPYSPAVHAANLIASRKGVGNNLFKEMRPEYYAQIQMNMMCLKLKKGIFSSFDPRPVDPKNRLAIIYIEQDEELQAEILERIHKAAEIVSAHLDCLALPSVLIAEHDPEVNATIIK